MRKNRKRKGCRGSILVRTVGSQLPVCLGIEWFGIDPAPFLGRVKKFTSAKEQSNEKKNCKRKNFHRERKKKNESAV